MARVRTDQAENQESMAARLRDFVLWLFVAGAAASAIDLVVLGHFEDARQRVPLVLLPAGLLVVAWHRIRPGYPGARLLQATMALFIASGVLGLWFHYSGNLAFELELHPSLAGWELLRETLSGATPTLAPALMVQLGLLGLIHTYRHPILERRPIAGRPAVPGAPAGSPDAATSRAGRRGRVGRIATTVLAAPVASLAASVSVVAAAGEPSHDVHAADLRAADVHAALFAEERFPSATTCARCHAEIYREWSVSAHAYAQLSPVLNAMQAKIGKLTNGTNGDFCVRCHTPVGMQLGEPTFLSTLDRHPASREGVTCIVCHRQDQAHGKISGRLPLVEGSLHDPVFGPGGSAELRRLIETGDLNLQTDPDRPGRAVHAEVRSFLRLPQPGMCGTCHDVSFVNGFRLEEAFSEYKLSPAAGRGVTCQDCHMGTEPGVPSGYATGPAARVGGRAARPRKRTNHMFAGPDHSIVHPGIFPHNPEAQEFATPAEWLTFDHEAGWGTDAFEEAAADGHAFPPRWAEPDDRYDARDIIDDNLDLLAEMDEQRRAILRAGYRLGDVVVERADRRGLAFRVEFRNGTDGHNVPTGFDAERLVWLHVTVTDAAGTVVLESGDLDPNGDVRDSHSLYVHDGALPADEQLFSLQSRFLVRMVRGGEREQVLAVPYSPSPLVFARPATSATVLTGRPVNARKHRRTIPPRGSAWASYSVGADALGGTTGPYHATIRVKAGMVPVNLVHEIADVGFDYGMTEREVAAAVVAGHVVVRERTVDLSAGGTEVEPRRATLRPAPADPAAAATGDLAPSGLSDEPVPLQIDSVPARPRPLLELGDPFLGSGEIGRGFTLPGGAVWRPSFLLFGTLRSGVDVTGAGSARRTEWANRVDLFGNLALTGTERFVIGLRPADQTDPDGRRRFSGYAAGEAGARGFGQQLNLDWDTVTHLFFEGDFGELFPNLDPDDRRGLDLGLAVGRQPIAFQDGLLIDDFIDAVGVTRNNLRPGGAANLRFTGLYGWNQINRHPLPVPGDVPGGVAGAPGAPFGSREAERTRLVGGFTEIDWRSTTAAFDVIYLRGGTLDGAPTGVRARDGLHAGVSFVGRPGSGAFNAAVRLLTSVPVGQGVADPALGLGVPGRRGMLAFSELSWTPHHADNFLYVNAFHAHGDYRAAALDPTIPGPLARAGILFAGPGLGTAGGALSPLATDVTGGAVGQQIFSADRRRQLLLEGAARYSTAACASAVAVCEPHAIAGGARVQVAVGRRSAFVFDTFAVRDFLRGVRAGPAGGRARLSLGGRAEMQVRF